MGHWPISRDCIPITFTTTSTSRRKTAGESYRHDKRVLLCTFAKSCFKTDLEPNFYHGDCRYCFFQTRITYRRHFSALLAEFSNGICEESEIPSLHQLHVLSLLPTVCRRNQKRQYQGVRCGQILNSKEIF